MKAYAVDAITNAPGGIAVTFDEHRAAVWALQGFHVCEHAVTYDRPLGPAAIARDQHRECMKHESTTAFVQSGIYDKGGKLAHVMVSRRIASRSDLYRHAFNVLQDAADIFQRLDRKASPAAGAVGVIVTDPHKEGDGETLVRVRITRSQLRGWL